MVVPPPGPAADDSPATQADRHVVDAQAALADAAKWRAGGGCSDDGTLAEKVGRAQACALLAVAARLDQLVEVLLPDDDEPAPPRGLPIAHSPDPLGHLSPMQLARELGLTRPGYRVLTTVEELELLPVGALVCAETGPQGRVATRVNVQAQGWELPGWAGQVSTATVLERVGPLVRVLAGG